MNPHLERIVEQVAVTDAHWRQMRVVLLAVATLIIALAIARQIWFLVAIGGVMFAGFAWLSHVVLARSDWSKNPVLMALRERPQDIVEVKHWIASSSSGAFAHSFFSLSLATGKPFALRVPDKHKREMAQALRAYCPNARFAGPGFDKRN